MGEFTLVRLGKLDVRATAGAVAGFLLLSGLLTVVGSLWLDWPTGRAALAGFLGALLHVAVALTHNLSHAIAARLTGHPMRAILLGRMLFLGAAVYPDDEPPLPGRVHVFRALGGPVGSLLLAVLAGGLAWTLRPSTGVAYWLALFTFLDSFLVFFLGSLLPLGFTDMSTLLYWWGK